MKSEKQAMASVSFCGHDVLSVLGAHGGHAALRRERLGGVEDGERGGQHGEDDERTAEANPTKCELGHADTSLDFLSGRLAF